MKAPKLNGTALRLLREARGRSPGRTRVVAQWGLHRGRGGTGKLRPFGNLEYRGWAAIRAAGLLDESSVKLDSHQEYVRGYASTSTAAVAYLNSEGEAFLASLKPRP